MSPRQTVFDFSRSNKRGPGTVYNFFPAKTPTLKFERDIYD
jgi:hypothetical protein